MRKSFVILIFLMFFGSFLLAKSKSEAKYEAMFYVDYYNKHDKFPSNTIIDNSLCLEPDLQSIEYEQSCEESHLYFQGNSFDICEIPAKYKKCKIRYSSSFSYCKNIEYRNTILNPTKQIINIEPGIDTLGTSTVQGRSIEHGLINVISVKYYLKLVPKEIKCDSIEKIDNENLLLYDDPICIQATKGFPKEVYKWRYLYLNAIGDTIKGTFTPFKTEDNGATIYVKGSDFLSESAFHDLVYREEAISIIPDGADEYNKPLSVEGANLTAKPSAPNITKVKFDKPKCSNTPATNVIVYFNRPIAKGESFILHLDNIDDARQQKSQQISNLDTNKYIFSELNPGSWALYYKNSRYLNKKGENVASYSEGENMRDTITISAPDSLSLKTKNSIKTICPGDSNGKISCHITGGTGSKTYSLYRDDELIRTQRKDSSDVCVFTELPKGTYTISTTDINGCRYEKDASINIEEPRPISISASVDSNPKCQGSYDGGISYNTSGGTGNIKCYLQNFAHEVKDSTYSNSFSGLSAGTYYLSAKDTNNCFSNTIKTRLEAPEALFLSLETKNNTKKGGKSGELFATFGGGTEPYILDYTFGKTDSISAKIDTLLSKTLPTVDTLVVLSDKNGCITSKEFSITEPDSLKAVVRQVDFIKCYGDSTASLEIESITGGTPPYYIKWSHFDLNLENKYKIDNLPASSYMLKVKTGYQDSIFISVDIDEPNKINLLSSVTNTACVGEASGSILLNANGGTAPYKFSLNEQYSSSGEYNQLEAGYYNISVEDENGCKTGDTVEVKTLSDINLNVTSSSPTCYGIDNGSIFITIDNGESPYSVHIADKDYSEVKGNLNLEDLKAGYYNIEVKDSLGCIKTADAILTEPTEFNIELPEKIYLCNDQSEVVNIENERITNVDWYLNNDLIHTGLNNKLTQEGVYRLDFLYDEQCHSFGEIEVDTINKKVDANFLVAAEIPINDDAHLINITPKENYEYVEWVYPTDDAWVYGEDEHSFQLVFLNEGIFQVGMIAHNDKCTASLFKTIKTFTPSGNNVSEDNTYHITELSIDKSPNNGKFISYVNLSAKTDVKLYLYNASTGHIIATKEVSGEKSYEIPFSVNATAGEYILLAVAPTWQKSKWIKMIIK